MLNLGSRQTLTISELSEHGAYLKDKDTPSEKVLLPRRYVNEDMKKGDALSVFLYLDSEDRPVATTDSPLLCMDEVRPLVVKEVNRLGAFLDWGLPKDLFLPYKEMTGRVRTGDCILARLYIDKSGRLAASMKKLYPLLSSNPPYQIGDEVSGRIYEFGHEFGTFVAVEDRYSAMIPRHEDMRQNRIGDVVKLRVTGIKEDGKLDVSTRKKRYEQMKGDAEAVYGIIESYGGVLPFSEKANSEVIFRETGLSKGAFKRAVGKLYKERRITLEGGVIRSTRDSFNSSSEKPSN